MPDTAHYASVASRTARPLLMALTGTPLINDIDDFRAIWQFLGWIDETEPLAELMGSLERTGLTRRSPGSRCAGAVALGPGDAGVRGWRRVARRSEKQSKLVQRDREPIPHRQVDGQGVVAAAQVLHERVYGGDGALINRPIQVCPAASDLDVGLVDKPAVPDGVPDRSGSVDELRREPLHPPLDRHVVDFDAACSEQLLDSR